VHAHCFPNSNKIRASVPDMLFLRDAPCEITNHRKHWPLKGCCFGGSVSEGPLPSALIFVGSVEIFDVHGMLVVCADSSGTRCYVKFEVGRQHRQWSISESMCFLLRNQPKRFREHSPCIHTDRNSTRRLHCRILLWCRRTFSRGRPKRTAQRKAEIRVLRLPNNP